MKTTKINILYYVIILFCIVFVGTAYFNTWKEWQSLKKNAEYTEALILEIKLGTKGKNNLYYLYRVRGKMYEGHVLNQPGKDSFSHKFLLVGDSCIIAYDKTNPRISTPYTDFTR